MYFRYLSVEGNFGLVVIQAILDGTLAVQVEKGCASMCNMSLETLRTKAVNIGTNTCPKKRYI